MPMMHCQKCGERFAPEERYEFCPHIRKSTAARSVAPAMQAVPVSPAPVPRAMPVGPAHADRAAVEDDMTGQRDQDGTAYFGELHEPSREVSAEGTRLKQAGRRVFKYDDGTR